MQNVERKTSFGKLIALALSFILLATAAGMTAGYVAHTSEAIAEDTAQSAESKNLFTGVYNQVSQSVVGVKLQTQYMINNGRIQTENAFVGSGVVIKDEYVVTNYHVVSAGTGTVGDGISVTYQGEEYLAKYVAGDEESDVAVLQVKDLPAPAVAIGDSDAVSVGDWALVVGNPLGETFTNTLTVGVISGLNRDVASSVRNATSTEMIQTDAAINSGNSGGGLFNIDGELIGITSSKMSSSGFFGSASIEGIGLAIPINTVIKIADDLIDFGKVIYPRLGVTISTINSPSEEPTEEYLPQSVLVRNVESGSPAEEAGIAVYDMITKADGQRVKTNDELMKIVRSHEIGDTIELEIYRIPKLHTITENEPYPEGETLTFSVKLEALD